ncbi:hypothetical protein V8D89_010481 [Ganoderma adspersum]
MSTTNQVFQAPQPLIMKAFTIALDKDEQSLTVPFCLHHNLRVAHTKYSWNLFLGAASPNSGCGTQGDVWVTTIPGYENVYIRGEDDKWNMWYKTIDYGQKRYCNDSNKFLHSYHPWLRDRLLQFNGTDLGWHPRRLYYSHRQSWNAKRPTGYPEYDSLDSMTIARYVKAVHLPRPALFGGVQPTASTTFNTNFAAQCFIGDSLTSSPVSSAHAHKAHRLQRSSACSFEFVDRPTTDNHSTIDSTNSCCPETRSPGSSAYGTDQPSTSNNSSASSSPETCSSRRCTASGSKFVGHLPASDTSSTSTPGPLLYRSRSSACRIDHLIQPPNCRWCGTTSSTYRRSEASGCRFQRGNTVNRTDFNAPSSIDHHFARTARFEFPLGVPCYKSLRNLPASTAPADPPKYEDVVSEIPVKRRRSSSLLSYASKERSPSPKRPNLGLKVGGSSDDQPSLFCSRTAPVETPPTSMAPPATTTTSAPPTTAPSIPPSSAAAVQPLPTPEVQLSPVQTSLVPAVQPSPAPATQPSLASSHQLSPAPAVQPGGTPAPQLQPQPVRPASAQNPASMVIDAVVPAKPPQLLDAAAGAIASENDSQGPPPEDLADTDSFLSSLPLSLSRHTTVFTTMGVTNRDHFRLLSRLPKCSLDKFLATVRERGLSFMESLVLRSALNGLRQPSENPQAQADATTIEAWLEHIGPSVVRHAHVFRDLGIDSEHVPVLAQLDAETFQEFENALETAGLTWVDRVVITAKIRDDGRQDVQQEPLLVA